MFQFNEAKASHYTLINTLNQLSSDTHHLQSICNLLIVTLILFYSTLTITTTNINNNNHSPHKKGKEEEEVEEEFMCRE